MKKRVKDRRSKNLEAINRQKTAKDAFFETGTQHYHIILFIHGDLGADSSNK